MLSFSSFINLPKMETPSNETMSIVVFMLFCVELTHTDAHSEVINSSFDCVVSPHTLVLIPSMGKVLRSETARLMRLKPPLHCVRVKLM